MIFNFNNDVTKMDLSQYFPVDVLHDDIANDGRILGNLMETILDHSFENLTKKQDNQYYDMDTPDNRTVEVRVKNVSFEASSNMGKNRHGNGTADTEHKINNVTDWLIVDMHNFPIVDVHHVTGTDVKQHFIDNPKTMKTLTWNQFKRYFKR